LGQKFKSLSVTALNDTKDMTTLLQQVSKAAQAPKGQFTQPDTYW
jgi:hypothetical protein